MNMRSWLPVVALLCGLLCFNDVSAKDCPKCKLEAAWGLAAQPETVFDDKKIGRYEGQVLSVQEVAAAKDVVDGIYVLLKTQDGNMSVRLGPSWYLKRQGFAVEPYDTIEILGSKVTTVNDRPAIVATKAKAGAKTIALRDTSGKVVWDKTKRG
ncbi:MAG: hypothetical protein Q8K75_04515 [Chlamydiales bacterium]|nr:hypothetical protein [Chlamydiales bacterium]